MINRATCPECGLVLPLAQTEPKEKCPSCGGRLTAGKEHQQGVARTPTRCHSPSAIMAELEPDEAVANESVPRVNKEIPYIDRLSKKGQKKIFWRCFFVVMLLTQVQAGWLFFSGSDADIALFLLLLGAPLIGILTAYAVIFFLNGISHIARGVIVGAEPDDYNADEPYWKDSESPPLGRVPGGLDSTAIVKQVQEEPVSESPQKHSGHSAAQPPPKITAEHAESAEKNQKRKIF